MKTTSLLLAATTASALCLFGTLVQTAKADSPQNDKHHKKGEQSGHGNSLHADGGHHGVSSGGNRGHSSHATASRPQVNHQNRQVHQIRQSHQGQLNRHSSTTSRHVNTHGNRSGNHGGGHHVTAPSRVTTHNTQVNSRTVKSHGNHNSHRVSSPVRINTHTSRVRTTNRSHENRSHGKHFRVTKTQYTTFRNGGWRHHHGWSRDRDDHFFYNRHRIFFNFSSGYYLPYYYGTSNEIIYLPQTTYYDTGGQVSVSDVQQALANEGYYNGAIDGISGRHTTDAIINFQRDHNLAATGEINSALIDALGLD